MINQIVSIIITTHNRQDLLPRALNSVLNQTYKNIEIIIVDDGSKDNTEQVVKSYMKKHKNIKYIKHQKALGGNAARNTGIKAARGEFIAGLDDDDEFTAERIEILMKHNSEKYSMITSKIIKITNTRKIQSKYSGDVDLNKILQFNAIGNQVLVKKEYILGAGMFDETLKRYQDVDMWLRIIQKYGKAKVINKITQIIHAEHDIATNNSSRSNFKGAYSFYKKHKHLMNRQQRIVRLFGVYRWQNKKLSIKKIRLFLTRKTFLSMFKYIFILRLI